MLRMTAGCECECSTFEAARQALFCIVLLGPALLVVKTASQRITRDCEFNLSVWSESPADLIFQVGLVFDSLL